MLSSKKTVWTTVVVSQWYNAQQRKLLTATGTALWYKAGVPPVPIRWVLVRDPTGEHAPAAFLSTDLKATPDMILGWFVSRWRVETTFQEVRTHLGVETQRQWSDRAILRTTPVLLGLFSLITLWADDLARNTAAALRPNATGWVLARANPPSVMRSPRCGVCFGARRIFPSRGYPAKPWKFLPPC